MKFIYLTFIGISLFLLGCSQSKDHQISSSESLTADEENRIIMGYAKCWTVMVDDQMNPLYKDPIVLNVLLNPDATVKSIQPNPPAANHTTQNKHYKAALQSAINAIHKCSPNPYLSKSKYKLWKELEITFFCGDIVQQ